MMQATVLLTNVRNVTLWEDAQPIGECILSQDGKIVVAVKDPESQEELERFIQVEFQVQRKLAKRNQQAFDASLFLSQLPRILGSCGIWATRPTIMDILPEEAYVHLPPIDPEKLSRIPRRSIHS